MRFFQVSSYESCMISKRYEAKDINCTDILSWLAMMQPVKSHYWIATDIVTSDNSSGQ